MDACPAFAEPFPCFMKETIRIARFITIGTLNAAITVFMFWLMVQIADEHYTVANVVAYVVAQLHNFVWCKYWVFTSSDGAERKNAVYHQMLYFACAFAVAYVAQFLFLLLLVEGLHCNEYLAQFLGLFVYGTINFLANRHITFR